MVPSTTQQAHILEQDESATDLFYDGKTQIKLLQRGIPIGIVVDKQPDVMGCCADIQLLPAAEQYKPMFNFLIDEERNHEEPPFSEEWLNGWEMEDDEGKKQDIFTPCIDNNYTTVEWRW